MAFVPTKMFLEIGDISDGDSKKKGSELFYLVYFQSLRGVFVGTGAILHEQKQ